MDILEAARSLLTALDLLPDANEWAYVQEQCAPEIAFLQEALLEAEELEERVCVVSGF